MHHKLFSSNVGLTNKLDKASQLSIAIVFHQLSNNSILVTDQIVVAFNLKLLRDQSGIPIPGDKVGADRNK